MKRTNLIRHLTEHGCELMREGGRHSLWVNPRTGETQAIPRHTELKDYLARRIARDLGVPPPPG